MTVETKLPIRLGKSPLVEASFEIRFKTYMPVSSVLAGILYTALGATEITRLPQADIPDQFRNSDPNLMYAPLTRIKCSDYFVSVGDRSLIVSNPLPYRGWKNFSDMIKKVISLAGETKLIGEVERFSLKYTDILDIPEFPKTGDGFKFKLSLPGISTHAAATHFRTEVRENDQFHIIQYFGDVQANTESGISKNGIMIDIDSIQNSAGVDFSTFNDTSFEMLDSLHQVNKSLFFELLSESGLNALEPVYA